MARAAWRLSLAACLIVAALMLIGVAAMSALWFMAGFAGEGAEPFSWSRLAFPFLPVWICGPAGAIVLVGVAVSHVKRAFSTDKSG